MKKGQFSLVTNLMKWACNKNTSKIQTIIQNFFNTSKVIPLYKVIFNKLKNNTGLFFGSLLKFLINQKIMNFTEKKTFFKFSARKRHQSRLTMA